MIKRKTLSVISAALAAILLLTTLGGCGKSGAAPEPAEPTASSEVSVPAEPAGEPAAEAAPGRQDGERFEDVIILEGMEETVRYEHLRREDLGFRMNYDYENFLRQREADRERFVSDWDDPENPENYLEVTYDPGDPAQVADAVSASLSQEYDLLWEDRELDSGLSCTYIEASVIKGTNQMADHLQAVYIIPAGSGSIVAAAHYAC